MRTDQPVALITGCSEFASFGAALALELEHQGWRVFATARKVEMLDELKAEGCDVGALSLSSCLPRPSRRGMTEH